MLRCYLFYIRAASRETGKGHVSTDVTPGILMMYRSYCFAAEDNIMIPEVPQRYVLVKMKLSPLECDAV
jgi:hypothetical protein